ncbi:MAG: hypothetical protein ACXW18_03515 [Pyrinomonadaceae bacterium]
MFFGLPALQFLGSLLVQSPPLIIVTTPLRVSLALFFVLTLLVKTAAVLFLAQPQLLLILSFLIGIAPLLLLCKATLFFSLALPIRLTALILCLTLIVSPLLFSLPLPIHLTALFLCLTLTVSPLLFGLPPLLRFIVAAVFVLALILRFALFPLRSTVFTVVGFLRADQSASTQQRGESED